ncbi:hypothetical protein M407DRAFT_101275 [Tulasnella calospora MUT 4182]|uniref:Fungal-type protein kinase domain-containing protein n=1 Tax=Tulasnella calospora MUT 4182 TaxID=1051891 RepID=A0A0C3QES1_9AGAM|nr:hypothetical protein M407DRAFT_101275 [Tulasnella calospora MUT 4182]
MGFATLRDCQGIVVKLHDFDLSKRHESPPANSHWTGTLPFVAIALLENQDADHQIGFDVEALMWTLLWIVRVYEEGKTVNTPFHPHPLKNWFWNCGSLSDIAAHKKAYLLGEPPHPWTNDFYKDLEPDMRSLATMWSDLLWDQTKARRQKGGDFLSDKVYGKPGFLSIQGWMKGEGWDEPWEHCLCKHHCAE